MKLSEIQFPLCYTQRLMLKDKGNPLTAAKVVKKNNNKSTTTTRCDVNCCAPIVWIMLKRTRVL